MSKFIATMIEKSAKISTEEGQEKYRSYFINTTLYTSYKEQADAILVNNGFGEVIVTE